MNEIFMKEEINKIKKEKNIKILAHNYQNQEVQEIADYIGDSFYLSKISQELDCKTVIFCGVKFMAETTKILSPDKKVILPVEDALCPMAHMVTPQDILEFKKEHPDFKIVGYVNTTADVKEYVDVCVTSSIAVKVMKKIEEKNILFIPDMNLGNYIAKKVEGKNIISWNGYCNVHDRVKKEDIINIRKRYPDAPVLVHPECREEVVISSDFVGSTSEIIEFANGCDKEDIIIGTETGVLHLLRKLNPNKKFHLLSPSLICPNMKKTTLQDVYNAVIDKGGIEIELEENTRIKALRSLEEMMRLAK